MALDRIRQSLVVFLRLKASQQYLADGLCLCGTEASILNRCAHPQTQGEGVLQINTNTPRDFVASARSCCHFVKNVSRCDLSIF